MNINLDKKKILLSLLRIFFHELYLVTVEDILSVGRNKFFLQFIKAKLIGRKGIYSLMPSESTIIGLDDIKISGNLLDSRLIRSLIASKVYIQAINKIFIDSSVLIGPDVKIISANHNSYNYENWDASDPIVISENVWIGANVVILPEVNIGSNCIIGSGAVVTKSFDKNSVIAGNPAKLIRKLNIDLS